MRKEGWANQGYYPTPQRVTSIVAASVAMLPYRRVQITDDYIDQCRILDPCCGEGIAVQQFGEIVEQRGTSNFQTFIYGLEINRDRASKARTLLDQVWNADIDQTRIYPDTYHCLWLNPPYDWDRDPETDTAQRLESRFLHKSTPGLVPSGLLVYIIPYHVLAHDAHYLVTHYDRINVLRFPDPEYDDYHQVVVTAQKRHAPAQIMPNHPQVGDLRSQAQDLNLPIPMQEPTGRRPLRLEIVANSSPYVYPPLRVLRYAPDEVHNALQNDGLWHKREMRDLLDSNHDTTRIRPLEQLPAGHAAMAAANSMVDNALIPGATDQDDPIIVRGFFRKRSRETMRTEDIVVRTDHFESNIRAMNAVTGQIEEVGSDPQGLKTFMDTYGPAIRRHIDIAYPPAIDLDSAACIAIRERISELRRPLIGKQLDAATIGAAHLKNNRHLNLYFTQGSGKTCTAYGVAHGIEASTVAVMTPSRVIRNWITEIRSVWPDAFVRVVDNKKPIGTRRPANAAELTRRPAPFARASLEEIRRMESWATPDTPIWVLFKKDGARSTYPTQQGLRWIGDDSIEPFRPLHHLAETEHGTRPPATAPFRRHNVPDESNRPVPILFRDQYGKTHALPEDNPPVGTCPNCWYPITIHEKWNPRDRNAVCLNERRRYERTVNPEQIERYQAEAREQGRVAGRYGGTWLSMDQDAGPSNPKQIHQRANPHPAWLATQAEEDEDSYPADLPPYCGANIAHAARNGRGRATYSYGDYASRYLGHWFDIFIIDEAQDYKARETAQGETARRLAQRSKKTISLTGTPFGGKVSELFFLLAALHPGFNDQYNYRELAAFRRAYGREETTYNVTDDGSGAAVGSHSRRRETKASSREIPGYHPALLELYWENTIFMDIQDVDPSRQLPTLTQRAHLLPMDEKPQQIGSSELSQKTAYETLDDALTQHVKSYLQRGSKRPLSQYLQETLTYPENCWQGTQPEDPMTREPIIVMPPLKEDYLYPKERALLELVTEQRARDRRCLVYCTHTGRRDTTARLMEILKQHDFRVLQLKTGTVDSEERAEWLAREADRNDIIICHPKLVETGVNLLDYPTIIWFEIEYSMFTTEQASARSYRINQHRPVEIYYLAYQNTMQERALRIIARKADVSRTFHGDLSKNGLSAFNPDPDDIREQLARELLRNGHHDPDQDLNDTSIQDLLASKDLQGADYTFTHEPKPEPEPVRVLAPPAPDKWDNKGARQLSMLFD